MHQLLTVQVGQAPGHAHAQSVLEIGVQLVSVTEHESISSCWCLACVSNAIMCTSFEVVLARIYHKNVCTLLDEWLYLSQKRSASLDVDV